MNNLNENYRIITKTIKGGLFKEDYIVLVIQKRFREWDSHHMLFKIDRWRDCNEKDLTEVILEFFK